MDVPFTVDEQEKLDATAQAIGRRPDELVRDVVADYLDEIANVRSLLDARYEDIKSGRVTPIDGERFFEELRQRETELVRQRRH